ncbi:Carboxypeptidase S1-like protein B [Exophiala dermatitidis]|uniref:Carboxypeptidase D n=1 Tax=Exophiala dermatitidis (strain ATCC 34100 / CBS 525.76 / NIH/UT8656) TaxID=858893 RepID=H6C205_EXODN|nr:carboxypeptidase D [Exophiala dermatitidis NIH/UT8656]EHY57831.1 carboxypeptidase D [Exophiala dermatitidis NIH/UT8656]
MAWLLSTTAVLLSCASQFGISFAQFVTPPKNLTSKQGYANITVRYKSVPAGICEQDPDVKSFSGYADVAPGQHIFWWFFEARNVDPTTAPLTIWINGGPGSSSMIGLFQELGPCRVDENGTAVDNPYSWSNVTNMIFIDQPTQVGHSYSTPVPAYIDPNSGLLVELPNNTCPDYASDWDCGTYSYFNESLTANSTPNAAPNMWRTLQGFMGAFPQYARHDVFFTTESYGGHYAPLFSEYFLQQNSKQIQGAHNISLVGAMIGNGWYDPLIQYQAYYNFTVSPGNTYGYDPLNQSVKDQYYTNMYGPGNCYDQTVDCNTRKLDTICSLADTFCAQQVENLYDIYLQRDEYDFRYLTPNPFPQSYYVDYLNTEAVQTAIGAYVNYTESSNTVGSAFGATGDDDREIGTVEAVRNLVANRNVSVTMYFGDADYNCNWLGGQVVADHVNASGYADAGFVNISTSDNVVHGQVRQSGNFAFVRIYESGHLVPFFQPLVALEMLDRVIHGKDIATGNTAVTKGYVTKGPKVSSFKEGNATVQFTVTPPGSIYNTTTNLPQNGTDQQSPPAKEKRGKYTKRSMGPYRPRQYRKRMMDMLDQQQRRRPGRAVGWE